jgi:hypothetical protein
MLGRVVWTGVSSMDIAIEVHQAAPSGEQQQQQQSTERSPAMAALFTFVARDALNGTPQRINPLQPRTAEDKVLFASRQRIADTRKAVRAAEEESGQKCELAVVGRDIRATMNNERLYARINPWFLREIWYCLDVHYVYIPQTQHSS